jgi:hypothetical protein
MTIHHLSPTGHAWLAYAALLITAAVTYFG